MKYLFIVLSMAMVCERVGFDMAQIDRCENDEVVCYVKHGIGGSISCIKKEE